MIKGWNTNQSIFFYSLVFCMFLFPLKYVTTVKQLNNWDLISRIYLFTPAAHYILSEAHSTTTVALTVAPLSSLIEKWQWLFLQCKLKMPEFISYGELFLSVVEMLGVRERTLQKSLAGKRCCGWNVSLK